MQTLQTELLRQKDLYTEIVLEMERKYKESMDMNRALAEEYEAYRE